MMSEIDILDSERDIYYQIIRATLTTLNEFVGVKIERYADFKTEVESEAIDIAMSTLQDVQTMILECLEDIKHL